MTQSDERAQFESLLNAAIALREAQKNYMANRGNNELGKVVAEKAVQLDVEIENGRTGLAHRDAELAEVVSLLKEYADADDCDADGAPDADNSRHSVTCRYCRIQTALARLRGKGGWE